MSRRKRASSDAGEGANWMDTYGDLVTLLLCFFVLLYSFSSIDAEKWSALVGAFGGTATVAIPALTPELAMEMPIELIQTTGGETTQHEIEQELFVELYNNVRDYLDKNNLEAEMYGDFGKLTLVIRFTENVLFPPASATLHPEAIATMDHVVQLLLENMQYISMVRIEGHTDNVPIHTAQYPSNWELSVSRAVNALRYMTEVAGFSIDKISAVGYGEYHPIVSNDSAESRSVNRRVDFVVESVNSNR